MFSVLNIIIFLFNFKLNILTNLDYYHEAKVIENYGSNLLVSENGVRSFLIINNNESVILKGTWISFEGKYQLSDTQSFNQFLYSEKSKYFCYLDEIEILREPIISIRNFIITHNVNTNSIYSKFLLAFIFGIETVDNSFIFDYSKKMGISHLLVMSGFHIGLVKSSLEKISVNNKVASIIIFYLLFLTFFPISMMRSFLYIVYREEYGVMDSFYFSAITLLAINPGSVFSFSFILSNAITYVVLQINALGIKNKVLSSFLVFLSTLPFLFVFGDSINLLSFIVSIILSVWIEVIYFFLFLSLFLFTFKSLSVIVIIIFIPIFNAFSFLYLPINFKEINIYLAIIFYLQYILILKFVKV